ncbi:MAG: anti-sigma factor [Planctomycetota bacterium]|jgi:hypothetical protein
MSEKPNIEELLNGFIDGELSERQQVEVQRLISNDMHIARRLWELEKCKMLVSFLPRAEAPAGTFERVKAALEAKALASQWSLPYEERRGARHLLFRKVLTAAAMIGLVAVLGAVVYTIVVPGEGAPTPLVGVVPPVERPAAVEASVAARPFYARLELKTGDLLAVDAMLNRAVDDNGLSSGFAKSDKNLYELDCGRESLGLLLADLEYAWQKLDSAKLIVETERFGEQVVIHDVKPEQITEIVGQNNPIERVRLAREFAASNRVEKLLPGREILVAIEGQKTDWAIPKPVFTSETTNQTTAEVDEPKSVHLSVALTSSR